MTDEVDYAAKLNELFDAQTELPLVQLEHLRNSEARQAESHRQQTEQHEQWMRINSPAAMREWHLYQAATHIMSALVQSRAFADDKELARSAYLKAEALMAERDRRKGEKNG